MSVEETLFTRLSNFAGLAALVSSRIYPLILPQKCALPALTYQRVATQPRESCMVDDVGFARGRFQFSAFASTFDGARAVIEQVRQALQRWSTAGIQDIFLLLEIDFYDPETLEYSSIMDFEVVYEEVV